VGVFFTVMILMLTLVIPNITAILIGSGQKIPIYTQVVIDMSNILIHYGVYVAILAAIAGAGAFRAMQTPRGQLFFDSIKLDIPYLGDLYLKLYLSRIADNFSTMLSSGVAVVEMIDITSKVVGSRSFEEILKDTGEAVRGGSSISDALGKHPEIPGIMIAMIRVGEETGELGNILETLAKFYRREVSTSIDTLVDLIEPMMIVFLGLGVGSLLASVLVPIYNLAGAVN
jgi:type IV pilus assembly protein PilC